ncbi:unnamed protein product, partial [Mesorhabditis belari]|uniref:G-protein coupled receptors family 1 profile domain-containing protein n=1 Tax=Mesorhabditis belari TaxID=2138241 RepID=A0AAF3FH29_9BILA
MLWFCVFHNLCLISELSYVFLNNFTSQHGWILEDCLRVSIPHLFVSSVQTVLSVSISLDLLIALLWPFQHRFYSLKRYVSLFLLPAFIYALITICWAVIDKNKDKLSWCNGALALTGSSLIWWLYSNVSLNCVNVIVYGALYILIARNGTQADRIRRTYSDESRNRGGGKAKTTEKKVLRSLSVLLAVYLFSWFSYIIGITIVRDLPLSQKRSQLLQSYSVILALICYSQNYYVMFILSNTYRRAFMEQLYILICKDVPEKYWPMSVTASRRASQNWQKARSEALAATGGSLHSSQ